MIKPFQLADLEGERQGYCVQSSPVMERILHKYSKINVAVFFSEDFAMF